MTRRIATSRWILFLGLALGGAAFDLATKSIIFQEVGAPPSAPVAVIRDVLELRTSYNPGALWGFGRDLPHSSLIFAGLSVVAGVAIVGWLFVGGAAASLPLTFALGLIMAGAIGNCYDRVVFGHVRDFVHFHIDSINFDWAIFNFADCMLVVGALTLVLFALRPEPAPVEPSAAPDESPAAAPLARDAESLPT
ncbi:signal peptidase II [Paludisphaera mucosa]|uniref:Lipoprotein signal peptidase n=1 Tax=Paludisphaera mucosa TaxID=3030827 RepID=A0ABT6FEJ7_9BACT|nr:signal peptidase II [Paludisphaera mucosa]MDG3006005.1 signal peptidase II [Paludisphaera mucosa]